MSSRVFYNIWNKKLFHQKMEGFAGGRSKLGFFGGAGGWWDGRGWGVLGGGVVSGTVGCFR